MPIYYSVYLYLYNKNLLFLEGKVCEFLIFPPTTGQKV